MLPPPQGLQLHPLGLPGWSQPHQRTMTEPSGRKTRDPLGTQPRIEAPLPGRPAGATPLQIAQAAPDAGRLRPGGEPLLKTGTVVADRYEINGLLGRGGFGEVYRARHTGTHETVALKVLRPELLSESSAVDRFTAEARLCASLRHPNTVRVFDFGQTPEKALYLAMEFLEGESLEEILARGPLTPRRAARITTQVLKSLAEAHGRKIVHRDLKPENILVGALAGEPDFVHVIDFGIAKFLAEGANAALTQAGAIIGTPHYMSPEQIRGDTLDARADLYSVGVLLYRCLSGRHPYDGDTTFGILAAHLGDVLPPLGLAPPDRVLDGIVVRSLARDRGARFATADAFRVALEQWQAQAPPEVQHENMSTQMSMDVVRPERLGLPGERLIGAGARTVVGAQPSPPEVAAELMQTTIGPPPQMTVADGAPLEVQQQRTVPNGSPSPDAVITTPGTDAKAPSTAAVLHHPGLHAPAAAQVGGGAAVAHLAPAAAAPAPLHPPAAPVALAPPPAASGVALAGVEVRGSDTAVIVPPSSLVRPPPPPPDKRPTVTSDSQRLRSGKAPPPRRPTAEPVRLTSDSTRARGAAHAAAIKPMLVSGENETVAMNILAPQAETAVVSLDEVARMAGKPAGKPQPAKKTWLWVPAVLLVLLAAAAAAWALIERNAAQEGPAAGPIPANAAPPPAQAAAPVPPPTPTPPAVASQPATLPALATVVTAPAIAAPLATPPTQGASDATPMAAAPSPERPREPSKADANPAKSALKPVESGRDVADEKPHRAGAKVCAAAEGTKEWCTNCPVARDLKSSSKHYCGCLEHRGATAGLAYYCKCVFPKEYHKVGSTPYCKCNPRDPACHE